MNPYSSLRSRSEGDIASLCQDMSHVHITPPHQNAATTTSGGIEEQALKSVQHGSVVIRVDSAALKPAAPSCCTNDASAEVFLNSGAIGKSCRQAQALLQKESGLLTRIGIKCPKTIENLREASAFLSSVRARINEINENLPEGLQYQGVIKTLIDNPKSLHLFLKRSYDHCLRMCFGHFAGVNQNDSLETSTTKINNWFESTGPSAPSTITEIMFNGSLNPSSGKLFCLPKEIGKLSNLELLLIKDNLLKNLPPEISQLQNLTTLTLSGNKITELPDTIKALSNLTWLDLSKNDFTLFPPEIYHISTLQTILLNENNLTELPPGFQFPPNIKVLEFRYNKFTEIPPEICEVKELEVLIFKGNLISQLPQKIENLSKLQILLLEENKFNAFPIEICTLTALRVLHLNNNNIQEIPKEIDNLKQLKELMLHQNELTTLPDTLSSLPKLKLLRLEKNHLGGSYQDEAPHPVLFCNPFDKVRTSRPHLSDEKQQALFPASLVHLLGRTFLFNVNIII